MVSSKTSARIASLRAFLQSPVLRALPYLLTWVSMLLLVCSRTAFWETNDDQHMAMIAHGYGITAAPSSGLVFSNVAWGWLVSHLGVIGGIQGYALGQYAVLLLACAVICRQLYLAPVPPLLGAAVPLLMFPVAILETEFTVTAGYAAVTGFAVLLTPARGRPAWTWLGAGSLLLIGSWLRLSEFTFTCMVAAPFVAVWLWQQPDRGRRHLAGLAGIAVLIGMSVLADRAYYSGPEWQDFKERTTLAQPFVDYGLADFYLEYPQRLRGSGLSLNDMQMLDERAFMDERVFNRASLQPLIEGVSLWQRAAFNLSSSKMALRPFQAWPLDLMLAIAVVGLLAASRFRPTPLLALAVMLGVMGVFWLLGRPGVVRIYLPASGALAVLTLLTGTCERKLLAHLAGLVLAAAGIWLASQMYYSNRDDSADADSHIASVCDISTDQLWIVWGAAGPYDHDVYRPLGPAGGACPLRTYVVGGLQLLPASVGMLQRYTGSMSLIDALLAGKPLYFISATMAGKRFGFLRRYLAEHYAATLEVRKLPAPKRYVLQVTSVAGKTTGAKPQAAATMPGGA